MDNADPTVPMLPERERCLLLAQWINNFAMELLATTGYGGSSDTTWNFQDADGKPVFKVQINPSALTCEILECTPPYKIEEVREVVSQAITRVARGDLGESVCYHTTLVSPEFDMLNDAVQFMRVLGSQVAIAGKRRLADFVVLDFKMPEHAPDAQFLTVPETKIDVAIFVPGGSPGPFSMHLAVQSLEFVRLICSLALARPVRGSLGIIFPAKPDDDERFRRLRFDPEVLGLARRSVSLDPANLSHLGDQESVRRYMSALVAYEAAMCQTNPDVSVVLLVSAIEAIVSPRQPWRKERPVARFQKAVNEYCPDTLDEILAHGNFEQAFGYAAGSISRRKRLDLLDRIYDLRSVPVHSGPSMFAGGVMNSNHDPGQIRVALVADLAESVLLRFIEAPRSSLIGHPEIWPSGSS